MSDPFERILGQPQVRSFLRAAVSSGRVGQSYLFTGPAGSNKTTAAYALAQAVLCPEGGCGTCAACKRVMRRRHPDVRYVAPEGATGYLVEQIREIVQDVHLAPIQATKKVYILDRVDRMNAAAANAFLKTLEEPPADVVLILLGRTVDAVLPTIVSRCQVVPFRHIPAKEAVGIVRQNASVDAVQARVALEACRGSISAAIEFCRGTERFAFRANVIDMLAHLRLSDDLDVLQYAARLLEAAQAPLDLVRSAQKEELAASAEFMANAALKQIELRNKRTLSAKSVQMLGQLTAIVRSWLRDVLVTCAGAPELVINTDVRDTIEEAATWAAEPSVARAIVACDETDRAIAYNVSPETCIDVLLITIREELYGSHSARSAAI